MASFSIIHIIFLGAFLDTLGYTIIEFNDSPFLSVSHLNVTAPDITVWAPQAEFLHIGSWYRLCPSLLWLSLLVYQYFRLWAFNKSRGLQMFVQRTQMFSSTQSKLIPAARHRSWRTLHPSHRGSLLNTAWTLNCRLAMSSSFRSNLRNCHFCYSPVS